MNERFDERFNFADIFEDPRRLCDSVQNDVKSFIQQEIDLAKKEERERIRDFLENSSVWDNEYIYMRKALMLQKFDEKITLITNNNGK